MSNVIFDTLQYAKQAKNVGFTEQQAEFQAEAIAKVMDEQLVTKKDWESGLKASKQDLENGLRIYKQDMENALKNLEYDLKNLIKDSEHRLMIKMGVMFATGVTILAAIIKF